MYALCEEFQYRGFKGNGEGGCHKSLAIVKALKPPRIPDHGLSPFHPQTIPAEYIVEDSVETYRNYYRYMKLADRNGKPHTWTKRGKPDWMNEIDSRFRFQADTTPRRTKSAA